MATKSNLSHFHVYELETSAKTKVCQWNDNHDKFQSSPDIYAKF